MGCAHADPSSQAGNDDVDVGVRRENCPPDSFLILLTPEIPVVARLGGRHFGVARLGLVLGGGRRVDDLAQASLGPMAFACSHRPECPSAA